MADELPDTWYDDGVVMLIDEIVNTVGISKLEATRVYQFLSDTGFIDYDIEKDTIINRYFDGDC